MIPSVLPKISELLLQITIHYPPQTKVWLETFIAQEPDFAARIGLEEKSQFVKSILGTRQLRRHRELVKSFALKCRGLENTLFGRSI